jgi:hypothetical protein
MKTLAPVALAVILSFSTSSFVFGWGNAGHDLVGRIAARRLTLAARRAIVKLIREAPDDDLGLKGIVGPSGPQPSVSELGRAMALMATWPDCMGRDAHNRCNPKGVTGPWHFVDVGLFEGPGHLAERCGSGSCVTEKIPTLIDNLKRLGAAPPK